VRSAQRHNQYGSTPILVRVAAYIDGTLAIADCGLATAETNRSQAYCANLRPKNRRLTADLSSYHHGALPGGSVRPRYRHGSTSILGRVAVCITGHIACPFSPAGRIFPVTVSDELRCCRRRNTSITNSVRRRKEELPKSTRKQSPSMLPRHACSKGRSSKYN